MLYNRLSNHTKNAYKRLFGWRFIISVCMLDQMERIHNNETFEATYFVVG